MDLSPKIPMKSPARGTTPKLVSIIMEITMYTPIFRFIHKKVGREEQDNWCGHRWVLADRDWPGRGWEWADRKVHKHWHTCVEHCGRGRGRDCASVGSTVQACQSSLL